MEQALPGNRFVQTMHVVAREARHLAYSRRRLYAQPITPAWVRGLEDNPELVETLEAFVSRFDRMQDTIANNLLPRWLLALAETPEGSASWTMWSAGLKRVTCVIV